MKQLTTIQIEARIRDRLKEIGSKGETYSHIIERLLDAPVTAGKQETGAAAPYIKTKGEANDRTR